MGWASGVAGGFVIATNISFLTDFVEVPHQAQLWVTTAIPVLIATYSICGTVYILSSEEAAAKRLVSEKERENSLDHQTRLTLARQWGQQQMQVAEIKKYMKLVEEGKLSAADANASIMAGETLGQLEDRIGRDVDGVGNVHRQNRRREPAMAAETEAAFSNDGRNPRKRRQ